MKFSELWADKNGPTFLDFLDIINPLQHIPIINTIYRDLTGDEIGFAARLIGGGLLGGPVGVAGTVISMAAEEAVGEEPVSRVVAALQEFFSPAEEAETPAEPPELAVLPDAASAAAKEPQAAAAALNSPPLPPAPAPTPVVPGAPAFQPGAIGAPLPAAASARKTPQQIAALSGQSTQSSESARISRKILEAQRAQASILLASIGMSQPDHTSETRPGRNEDESREASRSTPQHSNAVPPGASPEWIQRAMGQALEKYEQTIRLRGTGVALPLPTR